MTAAILEIGTLTPSPIQEFSPALFHDFINWIDRSEKTARSYLNNLKQFMAWIKYAAVKNPLREDILSYRQWLTTEIYLHNDTEKEEIGIAQRLYNLFHGKESESPKEKLAHIIDRLNPAKLEQLAGIAAAMI